MRLIDKARLGLKFLLLARNLRREQYLDRDSLGRMQSGLLAGIVESASATGHYSGIVGLSRPDSDSPGGAHAFLESMPITEREELRESPDSFIPKGTDASRLAVNRTSGSTGAPVTVFSDSDACSHRAAADLLSLADAGASPLGLMAEISRPCGHPGKVTAHLGIFRSLNLSVFDDESENLARLRRLKPDVLSCYTSYAHLLAAHNCELGSPARFRSVITGTETMTPRCRREIESGFGADVFDVYGNNEFGYVAWECPEEHRMHVHSRMIIEIIGDSGRPKKSGSGDIVITALHNRAMPLIRYRIGDRGSLGGDCPCGRNLPVLKAIEGRRDDLIILPSGRVRSPSCFCNIEEVFDGVRCYQLVQEAPERFVFRFVPSGAGLTDEMRAAVEGCVRRACLGEKVGVEFEEAAKIGREPGGKFRKFISRVEKPRYAID